MSDRIGVFNHGPARAGGHAARGLQRAGHALRRAVRRRGQRARRRGGAAPHRPQQRRCCGPERIRLGAGARRARQRRGGGSAVLRRVHAGARSTPAGTAAAGRPARGADSAAPEPGRTVHLHWDERAVHAARRCRGGGRPLSAGGRPADRRRCRCTARPAPRWPARALRPAVHAPRPAAAGCCSRRRCCGSASIYLGSLFAPAGQRLLRPRRLHRPGGARVHAEATSSSSPTPANLDVALRTITMAVLVTLACIVLGFPLAYYMARHARGAQKALLYIAVMLPLWSQLPGAALRLEAAAGQGRRDLVAGRAGCTCTWLLDALLATPAIGGPVAAASRRSAPSSSSSTCGCRS